MGIASRWDAPGARWAAVLALLAVALLAAGGGLPGGATHAEDPAPHQGPARSFEILYVGPVLAELEPCG